MKIVLVAHQDKTDALDAAYLLKSYLSEQGFEVLLAPPYRDVQASERFVDELDFSDLVLVISLGGDGTILRAARIIGTHEVPLLGLCFGHLGFLSCAGKDEIISTVNKALAGELHVSRRSCLSARVYFEDSEEYFEGFALNDLSLTRGPSGKMLHFDLCINGLKLDSIQGDGMVLASATGSTGYALSAGGPIVNPDFRGIVCVPIAAHSLASRAVLSAASDVVSLDLSCNLSQDTMVYLDGIALEFEALPVRIEVSRAQGDILLLQQSRDSFYEASSRVFYGDAR